jgi:hypothetical protein
MLRAAGFCEPIESLRVTSDETEDLGLAMITYGSVIHSWPSRKSYTQPL